jgi:octaprenyl-diphosphate synthase
MIACTTAGANSVEADDDTVRKMADFGKYLGIVFQIRDDLFDYDDDNTSGKPSGNDIIERKITLPLIYALRQCDKSEKRKILKIIRNKNKSMKMVNEVVLFIHKYKGISYAKKIMNEYRLKAVSTLSDLPNNEASKSLLELLEYTISRKK